MESQYLQNVRYKLQRRIRRLNEADHNQFLYRLKRFFTLFDSTPVLAGVAEELLAAFPDTSSTVEKIYNHQPLVGITEAEEAAIAYGVLRRYAAQDNVFVLPPHFSHSDMNEFRAAYLTPFSDYVDEHIDDRDFVLFTLLKYKHRCEWFRRTELYKRWEEDSRSGEKQLALDLNEYLFEQGVEFQVEPASASGRADIVAAASSDFPMVADAKVFKPGGGKAYLIQGFRQVYQYACDHNQPFGYLAIFNVSDCQLRFAAASVGVPVPYVTCNNKTIFFLEIDIFPHAESASKRKSADVLEITQEEILGTITASQQAVGLESK